MDTAERDRKMATALKELKDGIIEPSNIADSGIFTDTEKKWILDKFIAWSDRTEVNERYTVDIDPIDDPDQIIRTWGTVECDKKFPPIANHHMMVVAGSKGHGKTAYTFHIAEENAKTMRVEYITLEMTTDDIITRIAREFAGITKEEWRDKSKISPEKRHLYKERKRKIINQEQLLLTGMSDGDKTARGICKHIFKTRPELVIIDNLDLIDKVHGVGDIEHQNEATKELMNFCKNENIPIILVHHTNKGKEKGLNSIRGSGKITDNATAVIMVERTAAGIDDDTILSPAEKKQTILWLLKDRDFGDILAQEVYYHRGKFYDQFIE